MPATMKDIARDLGVSVVTVSKVLRNHPDIGDETRKRVLDRMKELNYTRILPRAAWLQERHISLVLSCPIYCTRFSPR